MCARRQNPVEHGGDQATLDVIDLYYRAETLDSGLTRKVFVMPERQPLCKPSKDFRRVDLLSPIRGTGQP